MSNNRLVFEGLAELRAALRDLPAELTRESANLVEGAANGAAVSVRAAYGEHRVSGNLQNHVVVEKQTSDTFAVAYVVKSTARHAYIVENGTEARHYITHRGVKHVTGKAPGLNLFVPAIIRHRHAMFEQLKALLQRKGLEVSGDA